MATSSGGAFRLIRRQLQHRRRAVLFQRLNISTTASVAQQSPRSTQDGASKTTDFGFETVAESLKASKGRLCLIV